MTERSAGFVLFCALLAVVAACGGSTSNDGVQASGAAGQASAGASNAGAGATSVDACSAPQVAGQCDAYMPSFWHDPNSGLCEPFIYGGCGGNDNRYPSRDECLIACPSSANAWGACKGDSDCRLVSPGSGGVRRRPLFGAGRAKVALHRVQRQQRLQLARRCEVLRRMRRWLRRGQRDSQFLPRWR